MNKIYILVFIIILIVLAFWFVPAEPKLEPVMSETALETGDANQIQANNMLSDGTYQVDLLTSKINWIGRKTLIANYEDLGTLMFKDGRLTLQGGKLAGQFTVDMNTIKPLSTGRGEGESGLEKHLKSADFFDVAKFPTATFELIEGSLTDATTGEYNLRGNLTIKGVAQEVSLPATLSMLSDNSLQLKAQVDLDRTRWDIRYGSDKFFDNLANNVISDLFTIQVELIAKPLLTQVQAS